MKKLFLSLIAIINIQQISIAQQPMTISPGLVVNAPTAGNSGLRFSNLNSGTTVSTTPTKVLSLDASGNVILGNAASGGGGGTPTAINVPVYASSAARTTAIPTPSTGMLTFNSNAFVNGLEAFNGTSWLQLNYWTLNSSNRLVSPGGGDASIQARGFISQNASSVASPVFAFTGGTNVFRYARSAPDANTQEAMTQETTTGFQPSTSSIVWNHYTSTTATPTRLFGFSGGTLTVNGFTKMGDEATVNTSGITRSSPAMKTILLTGALTQGASPETSASLTTTVPHGLTYTNIVDTKVLVVGQSATAGLVEPNFVDSRGTLTGWQFSTFTDANNVYIIRNSTNSNNIRPTSTGSVAATYRVLITYIP
jgi:hypothetical protein